MLHACDWPATNRPQAHVHSDTHALLQQTCAAGCLSRSHFKVPRVAALVYCRDWLYQRASAAPMKGAARETKDASPTPTAIRHSTRLQNPATVERPFGCFSPCLTCDALLYVNCMMLTLDMRQAACLDTNKKKLNQKPGKAGPRLQPRRSPQ